VGMPPNARRSRECKSKKKQKHTSILVARKCLLLHLLLIFQDCPSLR
jgi:hypothetical protein